MTAPDGLWAVVEIMGRRTRAGLISDAQLGGATLLRIEHPTAADHTGDEPLVEYYSPQAIFAIRPCSRDDAEKVAASAWRTPGTTLALAPAFTDLVDDDDGDTVDDFDDDYELERP
jgi:hypothetical protein